jgi:predicted nucleic acid-binding protein
MPEPSIVAVPKIVALVRSLARRAAAVRARTKLKLPDAFALATAVHAERRGHDDVRIESFDKKVNEAFADLHPRA